MFYTWKEFSDWIYVTLFEVFMFIVALLVSSFLLTIKLASEEQSYQLISWWTVHSPLFVFDALSAYFCIIIFIRQYQTGAFRAAFLRAFFSFKRIILLMCFKVLLCNRLEDKLVINFSEVFLPLFYCIFMLICRAFRL